MIDPDKWSVGLDYDLIPVDEVENDQAWQVRIERQFPETVIRYGHIRFDGHRDCLTFDYMVISSPDEQLTSADPELQKVAAGILSDIIERATAEGWLHYEEINDTPTEVEWEELGDDFGNQIGTDDSEELTDK